MASQPKRASTVRRAAAARRRGGRVQQVRDFIGESGPVVADDGIPAVFEAKARAAHRGRDDRSPTGHRFHHLDVGPG